MGFLDSDVFVLSKVWGFLDCIWWSLMTLTTVGFHLQPQVSLQISKEKNSNKM